MCRSMVDIHSATAEIKRGKKKERRQKKPQGKNVMACPVPLGGHKKKKIEELLFCSEEVIKKALSLMGEIFFGGGAEMPSSAWLYFFG